MTWRRLGVLIRQLPGEARLHDALGRPTSSKALEDMPWTVTDHLIATVADHVGRAHFKHYKPVKRPGSNNRIGRCDRPASEVRAYLARFRPGVNDG